MKYLIFLLMFSFIANATLNNVDKAYLATKNQLGNPGFENGKSFWTASAGTFAIATSGSNLLEGGVSATWDAAASADTLSSTLTAIPNGLYGKSGVGHCTIMTPSGTATHSLQVYDGTNILATETVISNTNPVRTYVHFLYPTSGSVRLRLYANADEPSITIDDCYLGPADGVTLIPAKPQDMFSAFVADGSSTTAVSRENADWISGNCTNGSTGNYTCTFNSGVFSTTPNCTAKPTTTSSGVIATVVPTSSNVAIEIDNNAGTPFDADFTLFCQKSGVNAPAIAFKADTLANSWSGYFDNTCSFARTNAAYGDSTDGSCVLTERTNRNFGTVTSNAASNIGITFTPKSAMRYYVCANASVLGATSGADLALKLWDGTTTIAERDLDAANTSTSASVSLCGQYVAASTSAVTLSLQTKSSTGAITIQALTGASAVEWSIIAIDQPFPAPMIANSVVTKSSAVMGIESADLNCDSGSAITSQNGSWVSAIGNISSGVCAVTISAGVFSSAPLCAVSASSGAIVYTSGATSTSFNLGAITDAGANSTSFNAKVLCVGPR